MRLVLIEWLDSYGCSTRWQEITDCEPEALMCKSVGWLVHDGDDCKVIVPHLAELVAEGSRQGCGDMTIPTVAIKAMRDLDSSNGSVGQCAIRQTAPDDCVHEHVKPIPV